jgi:hypothetical protein
MGPKDIVIILVMGAVCAFFLYRHQQEKLVEEGFTMASPCPNCGKRNKMDCFQCSDCGWCWIPSGYGQCVPGGPNGPYFRKDCIGWQYHPHPRFEGEMYLPGWRRWWWWRMPRRYRSRLRHRHNFRPPVVP